MHCCDHDAVLATFFFSGLQPASDLLFVVDCCSLHDEVAEASGTSTVLIAAEVRIKHIHHPILWLIQ